jgi:hypothetical protein
MVLCLPRRETSLVFLVLFVRHKDGSVVAVRHGVRRLRSGGDIDQRVNCANELAR